MSRWPPRGRKEKWLRRCLIMTAAVFFLGISIEIADAKFADPPFERRDFTRTVLHHVALIIANPWRSVRVIQAVQDADRAGLDDPARAPRYGLAYCRVWQRAYREVTEPSGLDSDHSALDFALLQSDAFCRDAELQSDAAARLRLRLADSLRKGSIDGNPALPYAMEGAYAMLAGDPAAAHLISSAGRVRYPDGFAMLEESAHQFATRSIPQRDPVVTAIVQELPNSR